MIHTKYLGILESQRTSLRKLKARQASNTVEVQDQD